MHFRSKLIRLKSNENKLPSTTNDHRHHFEWIIAMATAEYVQSNAIELQCCCCCRFSDENQELSINRFAHVQRKYSLKYI